MKFLSCAFLLVASASTLAPSAEASTQLRRPSRSGSSGIKSRRLSSGKGSGKGGFDANTSDDGSGDVVEASDILPRSIGKGSGKGGSARDDDDDDDDDDDVDAILPRSAGKGSSGKESSGKGSSGKGSSGKGATSGAEGDLRQGYTTDKSNDDKDAEDNKTSADNIGPVDDDFDDLGVNEAGGPGVNKAGAVRRYSSLSNDDP